MISPLPLPDWVPWWVHLVILLALLFLAGMFALMPFSIFGTKARLEAIEVRLDEIQAEIRSLALRLPEIAADGADDARDRGRSWLPPIPPSPSQPQRREPVRPTRKEPKLY